MGLFSIHRKVDENLYVPTRPMPWPVREKDVWLVTGTLAPDCLELTYDLSIGLLNRGYNIQSYPYLLSQVTGQELSYNLPGTGIGLSDVCEVEFRKAVVTALGMRMKPNAGYLIRKNPDGDGFLVAEIVAKTNHRFLQYGQAYIDGLPNVKEDSGVRFSRMYRDSDEMDLLYDIEDADLPGRESPELRELAIETKRRIEDLIMADFPVEVIETWLQKAVKLSRIKVTKDFRILLTDYNKEIKLRQLPKTLFLFFLKHPEGCRLKELSGHRDELLAIYRKLTNQDDEAQVLSSIDALTDPLSNSFSEKCAAVKLAFLKEIPERIAKNYYIQGPQGGAKGISLDRSLVEWEE